MPDKAVQRDDSGGWKAWMTSDNKGNSSTETTVLQGGVFAWRLYAQTVSWVQSGDSMRTGAVALCHLLLNTLVLMYAKGWVCASAAGSISESDNPHDRPRTRK